MNRISILVASLGLSIFGCRGGGGGGNNPDSSIDSPPGGAVHIQDVQNNNMPSGTAISLHGVVVTAIDTFGAKTGDLWVEEPGGGEFSGVKVFGAPLDQVALLQPGDLVDITNAEKNEFACSGTICGGGVFDPGQSITEVQGAGGGMLSIAKTGTGTLPAPVVVDALMIDMLPTPAERDAEWEKYEGVLITVTNARQATPIKGFGGMAVDQQEFDATGHLTVESTLSAFPAEALPGVCYQNMTGIGDYFFNYLLLPRATTELTAGGTGCAAQTVATISDIQAGTVTGGVVINDVFVTAVAHPSGTPASSKSFWIASSLTAAPNEGVFVFGKTALDASVVVGAKVNVIGTVQEFNDDVNGGTLTEITVPAVTVQAGAPGTVVPVTGKTATQLLVPATAPTFESVLVTLTNVNITTLGSATNGFVATAVQNGTTFGIGTDILQNPAPPATQQMPVGCYTTITGFWTNLEAPATGATTKPNAFGFIPATLGAIGTGCN